ncbi:MAG: glycerol-3-phosphate dehydrogenase [Bacteroidia bacterium]|nr:MAG: glycerol-3-phosphate dehydrogenase [Bacteroidia bacterium]
MNNKVAIIGGGSWATALVKIVCDASPDTEIFWYIRHKKNIEHIRQTSRNKLYLSSLELDTNRIFMSDNIDKIVAQADLLLLAVPSAFLESVLEKLTVDISKKQVVSAIKGIIPNKNELISQYMQSHYGVSLETYATLIGPSHAEEIGMERLTFLSVFSERKNFARQVATQLQTPYLSFSISEDVEGAEFASSLKNIYALAVGIAAGLGYGDNFIAVLISSAIRETSHLLETLVNTKKRNICDTAYLGDLLVTAYSKFSRNRMFGFMIGKGYSVKYALMEMRMIPEGYYTTESMAKICREKEVSMPIVSGVFHTLYGEHPASEEFGKLRKQLSSKIN